MDVLKILTQFTVAVGVIVAPAIAATTIAPIRLHSGVNPIPNIAGDGKSGSISLDWRDNGNAWGHDIFTVKVGGSVATVDDSDRFTDSPHTGDDMITAVRFGRGEYYGRNTTFALIASRDIVESVPAPAQTTIRVYVLLRNPEPLGTPYTFVKVRAFHPGRRYCNADMALKTEFGFPLARSYSGPMSVDGC